MVENIRREKAFISNSIYLFYDLFHIRLCKQAGSNLKNLISNLVLFSNCRHYLRNLMSKFVDNLLAGLILAYILKEENAFKFINIVHQNPYL